MDFPHALSRDIETYVESQREVWGAPVGRACAMELVGRPNRCTAVPPFTRSSCSCDGTRRSTYAKSPLPVSEFESKTKREFESKIKREFESKTKRDQSSFPECTVSRSLLVTHRSQTTQIRTCIVFLDHVQNLHIHAVRARSLCVFSVDFWSEGRCRIGRNSLSEAEIEYATGVH